MSGSTLTISGTALAGHVPIVQLAGTNLTVLNYSATIVTATMPLSVPPGSYEVELTRSDGRVALFDLTVGGGGATGPAGPPGPQALTGPTGATGSTRATGVQGPAGVPGATGAVGPQGAIGPPGEAGPQGTPGASGATGATGPQGAIGPLGTTGPPGTPGATGATGLVRPQGPSGATGAQGPAGPAGPAGTTTISCPDPANNIATTPGGHYYDCRDRTVIDTKTGLTWEKKDNNCRPSGSPNHDAANELHCVTNVYSWSLRASIQRDGTFWTDFLPRLNLELTTESTAAESTCFANHCDWRIPNIQELPSLLQANYPAACPLTGCIDPVFDRVYWPGTTFVNDFYSSSADGTYGYSATGAWGVNFNNGSLSNDGKQGPYLARAVRGGR